MKFAKDFDSYVFLGDSLHHQIGEFSIVARVEQDNDSRPHDYDECCYSPEMVAKWESGDWFYCGIVVSVNVGDLELFQMSLWGVEANFGGDGNAYLTEIANEFLPQAVRQLRDHAEQWVNKLQNALQGLQ
jgi:hypothetical protein